MGKTLPLVPSAKAGSMVDSPVGLAWREQHPIVTESCNQCLECTLFCPEGALAKATKSVSVNLQWCKGCGICSTECTQNAITMRPEFSGEPGIFPGEGVR